MAHALRLAPGATPTPQWSFALAAASAAHAVPWSSPASSRGAQTSHESATDTFARSGCDASTPSSLTRIRTPAPVTPDPQAASTFMRSRYHAAAP